jgi:hypothetical protein
MHQTINVCPVSGTTVILWGLLGETTASPRAVAAVFQSCSQPARVRVRLQPGCSQVACTAEQFRQQVCLFSWLLHGRHSGVCLFAANLLAATGLYCSTYSVHLECMYVIVTWSWVHCRSRIRLLPSSTRPLCWPCMATCSCSCTADQTTAPRSDCHPKVSQY